MIPYGNFMKNLIFSIFFKKISNSEKHIDRFNKLELHYNRLVQKKIDYANKIGADFRLYTNNDLYIDFGDKQSFNTDTSWSSFKNKYRDYEFDVLNLFKIHLLEKLAKEYDNVLYLDMDVIPNTKRNFFEEFDMNKICVRSINATTEVLPMNFQKHIKSGKKTYIDIIKQLDRYNEHVKALCKKAMLINQNIACKDYELVNTGIVGGNSNAISQLKFTDNLEHMLNVLKETKEEMFYDKDITDYFFPNNEVFFHYLLDKNNLNWFNLPEKWHKINYGSNDSKISNEYKKYKMIHLISKEFDELWKILDNNVEK